jgi:small subunit ribosomal protein S4
MVGPKERLSRREGANLFVKGARSFSQKEAWGKRQTIPGQHGNGSRAMKLSSYARQLREKQKVKRLYGMREKQFRRFYDLAVKTAKNLNQDKGYVMLQLLERRLDNVVYLAQMARSKGTGRQVVSHGHVYVNGKRVTIPSFVVRVNDVVEMKEDMYEKVRVDYKGPVTPTWLNAEKNKVTIAALPTRQQIDPSIRENLIVELYSR